MLNYLEEGNKKLESKDYEGALEYFNKEIEIDPESKEAYLGRGKANGNLKNYEEALKDFEEVLKIDSNCEEAYVGRGQSKNNLKNYVGALEDFNKAIQINPKYARAYNSRGIIKGIFKNYEKALEDFDKAIDIDSEYANAYNNKGITNNKLKNYEEALKNFDKAIDIDSEYANAYNNRGNLKKTLKDYSRSKKDYESALNLEPNNDMFNSNLKVVETLIKENMEREEGFLTFADILGWKGIWQKKEFEPEIALTKLISIKNRLQVLDYNDELKINLISDTFVIFCTDISLHNKACKLLIESCLEEGLLIRGAVSYGQHYNKETVYVGPAVDEAASWHEKAEEAAIFYTTSARLKVDELIRKELINSNEEEILNKYNLEKREIISKQCRIKTYSISWKTPNNRNLFYDIMLKNQIYPELYSKYINTEDYLRENK